LAGGATFDYAQPQSMTYPHFVQRLSTSVKLGCRITATIKVSVVKKEAEPRFSLDRPFTVDDESVVEYLRQHWVRVDVRLRTRRAPDRSKQNDNGVNREPSGGSMNNPFGYDPGDDY
jgi:hypothetical protein